jgi:uncharacterized cupredoxin-like copper-binding protein
MLGVPKWLFVSCLVVLVAAAIVAAGCGGGGDQSASELKVAVTESGKAASFDSPKEAEAGLVEVKLTNEGKAPHGLQLIRYTGDHTAEDVLKEVASESEKTPDWISAEGGIASAAPGETQTATLNLEEGNFVLVDATALFGEGGKPATAELKLTDGSTGDLPDTPATVVAADTGKDEYEWEISGLKTGKNEITFDSEGDDALHVVIAVPLKGKVPPLSQIKKDLGKESGPPPSYVDFREAQNTAVLDGGKSQTTQLDLKKPGKYLFFCPFTDRDGGKSHDQEGLLAIEEVQ